MIIWRGLNPSPLPMGSVVTIGNFDGVHRGHQRMLRHLVRDAKHKQMPSVVMTFDPHPMLFFQKKRAQDFYLSIWPQKIAWLKALGVEILWILPFEKVVRLSAHQFIQSLLVDLLNVRSLWIGYDFRFGAGRKGGLELLEERASQYGYEVHALSALSDDQGKIISSSRIRQCLRQGEVKKAMDLLGRPYTLVGQIQRGDGRGHGLGYPTANLGFYAQMLPQSGVYVTELKVFERKWKGITNVGRRPTFYQSPGPISIETHLLEHPQAELYGQEVEIAWIERLRAEQKFESARALVEQIQKDERAARAIFVQRSQKRSSTS